MDIIFKFGFIKTISGIYVRISLIESICVVPMAGKWYISVYRSGMHLICEFETEFEAYENLDEFFAQICRHSEC